MVKLSKRILPYLTSRGKLSTTPVKAWISIKMRNKGLSLIEMMVALFILAIVMGTVIVAFSQLQAVGKKTEMVMIAANLAQQRMEIAMRTAWENLYNNLNEIDTDENPNYIDSSGYVSLSPTDFRRGTIINENYSGDSRLTQVQVKLKYKSYGYRVGVAASHGSKILTGELLEKGWSPSPIELTTIMVDN